MNGCVKKILVLALLAACAHQPAPKPPETRTYTMMLGANRAGTQVTHAEDGRLLIDFEFNDRGRGPKTTTEIRIGERLLPVFEKTTGVDYFKGPVDETFTSDGLTSRWSNKAEHGELAAPGAFYASMYGPPEEAALLVNAILTAPDHRLALLPAGEATVEKEAELTVDGKRIVEYAISGLDFTPNNVWLERDGTFFASVSPRVTIVRDGYDSATKAMLDAQNAANE